MKRTIVFSFLLLVSTLVLSACENISSNEEDIIDNWSTFESAETDMLIQYPPELTVEFFKQEKAGFDVGRMRAYSFTGVVDGVNVDFSITATTENYGIGIGEGCCDYYAAPALDLSQSDEELVSDLESGYENYKTDPGKFLEVYGLERVTIGSHEAVRFSKPAGFAFYTLSDHFLIPNPSGEYSNLLVYWRSPDQTFQSVASGSGLEEFAIQWMDELTESDKKEEEIIESILSTLEFVELDLEDVEDTIDMEFDLFKGPAELEDLPFDASMSFDSGIGESDSSYTIWFNYGKKRGLARGGLVFDKEPITDPTEKSIPEGSTVYQSYSPGVVTYCDGSSCLVVVDGLDDYYRLTIIDEGLGNMELELLKEYIKTIQVR